LKAFKAIAELARSLQELARRKVRLPDRVSMRSENIDMILSPKVKALPAVSRPGSDGVREGAPANGRETRERFQLPDEARQVRQDQAAARRADARGRDVREDARRLERREHDDGSSSIRGLRGNDASSPPAMRKVSSERDTDASGDTSATISDEAALEAGSAEIAPPDQSVTQILVQGATAASSEAGFGGSAVADNGSDIGSSLTQAAATAAQDPTLSVGERLALSDAAAVRDEPLLQPPTGEADATSIALALARPELIANSAGRPLRSDAIPGPNGVPAYSFRGNALAELSSSDVGAGERDTATNPGSLENSELKRALGQGGLPVQAQGASAPAGLIQAQAGIGDLAQSNPAASQQGLTQALASLADAAGKAAAPPATFPAAPVVPNVPIGAVPIEIGLKALAGVNHFQIRLDPAELGRIDVNLDIDTDGTITARLTVDRVETLSLIQRDARTLERAFEQAGFKPSEGGVDLSLRDQGREDRRGEPERGDRDNRSSGGRWAGDGEAKQVEPISVHRTIWRGAAGIDVRI
jgi:flagellar hook-length control protein FliK